jgi:hypothetical protein
MLDSLLVVIDDLHVFSVAIGPFETDAPLVVDSDAVLTFPVAGEFFEAVPGRHPKVVYGGGCVEDGEFLVGGTG